MAQNHQQKNEEKPMNDKQTEWTKIKTDRVMDRLAEKVLANFSELDFDEACILAQRTAFI